VEELLHVCLAKRHPTPWALAITGIQVAFDALVTEDMTALGNDDVLLPLVANVAVEKLAHGIVLLLKLLVHSPRAPSHILAKTVQFHTQEL